MHIITEMPLGVLIRIGRLHSIYGSQQTCMLIYRVAIFDDVFDNGTEFLITARLKPLTDSPIIEIADGECLVIQEQGYQLMDIVGNQVPLWINDKALVLQERRRQVHLRTTALEPFFHLFIAPAVVGIHHRQTLHDHPHSLRQFLNTRQSAFILLAHHHALVRAHRRLAKPKGHQADTQGIEINGRGNLHDTVDHVRVHLWRCIDRCSGLCSLMSLTVLVEHA